MTDSQAPTIEVGMEARCSDGEHLGLVTASDSATDIVVNRGFLFPSDYYVPRTAIDSVDGRTVRLNVTWSQATDGSWLNTAAFWGNQFTRCFNRLPGLIESVQESAVTHLEAFAADAQTGKNMSPHRLDSAIQAFSMFMVGEAAKASRANRGTPTNERS